MAFSCTPDDSNNITYYSEVLPIASINLPATFTLGVNYEIEFTFIKPTSCHNYKNLLYITEGKNRVLAVNSNVFNNINCTNLTTGNIITHRFNFVATENHNTYKFYIWKGKDSLGNDIYDEIEIPVN